MDKKIYYACICEGASERVIINMLLDKDRLLFKRDELIDKEVLKCRNAEVFENKYLGKSIKGEIIVYRILDSRSEKFKLRSAYKDRVSVVNVITAPEIEMLIIINEGKFDDYNKVKKKMKPSEYCKRQLKMSKVKTTEFVQKYFGDIKVLENALLEYKRLCNVKKTEKCLADILK